ncbi:hypothetical protein GJA_1032 [Janthinobacterium agaricidamnosum NBRC 102515 = DSM 9628]|uniref:Uncharacterized protein n=1 Tax=Janthinobacterium agaricidamnosum NBRC 102515 = DSM 9628 TaxID=1349767 RepID=W0V337_9BURK|nr:hypothetical protein GJA_1032 [Janthinobacterium agaricidamnosum NBRC 102515 = DSM 9628]
MITGVHRPSPGFNVITVLRRATDQLAVTDYIGWFVATRCIYVM